jgi:hypothetical protein
VRRLLRLLVSIVAVLVAMTAPASAKAPPFTVELSDPAPSPGERVTVTVRMWDPADRSKPSTLMDLTVVGPGDLLGLVPAGDLVDGRPRAGSGEPVTLRNVAPATFRGSFVAPEHGDYRLVPFPRMGGRLVPERVHEEFLRQYPTTELTVHGGSNGGSGGWPVVPVAAVVALGTTAALVVAQRHRRQLRLAVTP